ncbi:hypothetical protein [Enterobacter phage N5822]|nr:hypothetical protein [Enterobacter phage N5822]
MSEYSFEKMIRIWFQLLQGQKFWVTGISAICVTRWRKSFPANRKT